MKHFNALHCKTYFALVFLHDFTYLETEKYKTLTS